MIIQNEHRYRLPIIFYIFFGYFFYRNRKHGLSCKRDILELKILYKLMHNTKISKYISKTAI